MPIYTGLPLPGVWQGQVSQTNEELVALPRGKFRTVEGIPFFATDATLLVGAVVCAREVAVIAFNGRANVMTTEMRALIMGMTHLEHDLLPPTEQRARINQPTWRPPLD